MRTLAGVALALLVVLAGCSAPLDPSVNGDGLLEGPDGTPAPDPPADRLGWEDGYWYNDTVPLDRSDGVNETEREAVVARTMARVERVRGLEFRETVPVEVISRAEYRNRSSGGNGTTDPAFSRFDNAKFEALFLIGEQEDSLATQDQNRGANVLGFYSPANATIVVVEGEDAALPSERTLAHELVHALQDQHFRLGNYSRPTREKYNAVNGLIEGDAGYVDQLYGERCDGEWSCFTPDSGGDGGQSGGDAPASQPQIHFGVYFLNFFPYSDGPGFVAAHRARGGWDAVNALYDDPPASTEQVIHPETYGADQPTDVALADRTRNGWTRVRPSGTDSRGDRPDYAVLGQSALSSMFAYTFVDSANRSSVVAREEFLNFGSDGRVNRSDPFDYGLAYTDGWDGDRLHVYEKDGETGYVWKLVWDSPAEAREFARGYRHLLAHWGGERVGEDTWRIGDGEFADAFRVRVRGDTVTVVNAPTVEALDDVRSPR